uniref:Uncharacterized protein n=1 Tax=Anguilla anguilla TaxID=7936 RepID=A0A0E9WKX4_ANGAN
MRLLSELQLVLLHSCNFVTDRKSHTVRLAFELQLNPNRFQQLGPQNHPPVMPLYHR